MPQGVRYFLFAKLPLFLIILVDLLIARAFRLYWIIERAVVTSPGSLLLSGRNVLVLWGVGLALNLVLSLVLGFFKSSRITEPETIDIRSIVFVGALFWVVAAGLENSLRAASIWIVILALGDLAYRVRWGSGHGFSGTGGR